MSVDVDFIDRMENLYGSYASFIYRPKDRETNRLVCNIGINDVEFSVQPKQNGKQLKHPIYVRWKAMLERCYSAFNIEHPTYSEVTCAEEFRSLKIFSQWMHKELNGRDINSLVLDKDLLIRGNKIYSPQTCLLIPKEVNLFLVMPKSRDLPRGVDARRISNGKYTSSISIDGNKIHLGSFPTIEEAHREWQIAKINHAKDLMNKYNVPELINIIKRIEQDIASNMLTETL